MKVSGAILAAGEAKRFGTPKQLLEWEDTTILGKVIKEFKNANFTNVYLILGAYYSKILDKLNNDLDGLYVINNKNWKSGMFSSIKCAIKESLNKKDEYLLIHQGDMPFITAESLNKFIQTAKSSDNPLIIGVYNNKPAHPYIIHRKIMDEVYCLNGEEGIRPVIKKYFPNAIKIEVSYLIGKQDIDTWEEYWRLKNGIHMG